MPKPKFCENCKLRITRMPCPHCGNRTRVEIVKPRQSHGFEVVPPVTITWMDGRVMPASISWFDPKWGRITVITGEHPGPNGPKPKRKRKRKS